MLFWCYARCAKMSKPNNNNDMCVSYVNSITLVYWLSWCRTSVVAFISLAFGVLSLHLTLYLFLCVYVREYTSSIHSYQVKGNSHYKKVSLYASHSIPHSRTYVSVSVCVDARGQCIATTKAFKPFEQLATGDKCASIC